ncbi:MAG: hypothetical protein H6730_10535 [Deltaproteobacteria bacterium]|nr:hypothetical protein [Deltaproteobacteria bacterium]
MSVALSAALGLLLVANAGPVQWLAGACDAPDAQATLTELLALEIRAMPPEAGVFLTFTACDLMGPTVLVALIDHGPRQPPERLVLPLGSIDRSARARAAALAIAESIRAAERAPPAPPTSAPTAMPALTAVAAPRG